MSLFQELMNEYREQLVEGSHPKGIPGINGLHYGIEVVF